MRELSQQHKPSLPAVFVPPGRAQSLRGPSPATPRGASAPHLQQKGFQKTSLGSRERLGAARLARPPAPVRKSRVRCRTASCLPPSPKNCSRSRFAGAGLRRGHHAPSNRFKPSRVPSASCAGRAYPTRQAQRRKAGERLEAGLL
jgi:hypothetical protein